MKDSIKDMLKAKKRSVYVSFLLVIVAFIGVSLFGYFFKINNIYDAIFLAPFVIYFIKAISDSRKIQCPCCGKNIQIHGKIIGMTPFGLLDTYELTKCNECGCELEP